MLAFFAALLVTQGANLYFISTGRFELNSRFLFGLLDSNLTAIFISIFFLLCLSLLYQKYGNGRAGLAFWLVLAGALSNLSDRIRLGGVIDYFSLPYVPLFNVADVLILAGAILLLIRTFRKPESMSHFGDASP